MYSRVAIVGKGYHKDACINWLSKNMEANQVRLELIEHIPNKQIDRYRKYAVNDNEYSTHNVYFHPSNHSMFTEFIVKDDIDLALFFNSRNMLVNKTSIPYKCVWPNHIIHTRSNNVNIIGSNIYLPYSDNVDWYDFFKQVKVRGFN